MDDKARKEAAQSDASRAAVYGLESEKLFDHPLTIPPNTRMLLSAEGVTEGHPALVRAKPKTIDDVKRWIGVPDEIGTKRDCRCKVPSEIPRVGSAAELLELHPNARRALRELAHEYVHGDSRRVAPFKPILDHLVDQSWINMVFIAEDIDIYNGAVLTVGTSLRVLWARNIRIWKGGLLKFNGPAKIDCFSIIGEYMGATNLYDTLVFGPLLIKEG